MSTHYPSSCALILKEDVELFKDRDQLGVEKERAKEREEKEREEKEREEWKDGEVKE